VAACLAVSAEERHAAFNRYFETRQQPASADKRRIHFR
jgi:hypothetical protein